MVTASHNPPEYNGFKITAKDTRKVGFDTGLAKIGELVEKDDFPTPEKKGNVSGKNVIPEYVNKIRSLTNEKIKPLKILFDAGNGMAGIILPSLLKGLPVEYDILYPEPDGSFPNHLADPIKPENTKEIQEKVVKGGYDFGVAYDADCDRVKFIDENGKRVRSEHILLIFAQELFGKCDVVVSANCSRVAEEGINELGGKTYVSQVGHVYVAELMRKHDCKLGAEVSGHFFFKDFSYADCGDAALILLMAALSKSGKKLSELVGPLDSKFFTSEEINFKVKDKDRTLELIEEEFKDAKISKIDGLTIDIGDYWFNIRESKNEPFLRLNAESRSEKALDECISTIKRLTQDL